MVIALAGGRDGEGGTAGGGDIRLHPPYHDRTVYCDQEHHGPVYRGGAEAGAEGVQVVMGTGRAGCGGDADSGLGGGTVGGGEETESTETETV